MSLPLSRAALVEHRDADPDAYHYRPSNVSEYKNKDTDPLVLWNLRIYDLDAAGRYLR